MSIEFTETAVVPNTTASDIVLAGNYLPSHDAVHDSADAIEQECDKLFLYIESVRDRAQARLAVHELLTKLGMVYAELADDYDLSTNEGEMG